MRFSLSDRPGDDESGLAERMTVDIEMRSDLETGRCRHPLMTATRCRSTDLSIESCAPDRAARASAGAAGAKIELLCLSDLSPPAPWVWRSSWRGSWRPSASTTPGRSEEP